MWLREEDVGMNREEDWIPPWSGGWVGRWRIRCWGEEGQRHLATFNLMLCQVDDSRKILGAGVNESNAEANEGQMLRRPPKV